MQIGNVKLATNLLLSPIAGYFDLPFRLILRPLGGVGLASTELLNPRGVMYKTPRSLQIARTCEDDSPLAIQLYGSDPDDLAVGAKWAADQGVAMIDINMGCPVPKIAGKGGGSGLLRCCPDAVTLAKAVVDASPIPVTVKTRLGWEMGNLVAPALAKQLADVGVQALTIHGRYGEQRFKGSVDLEGIARVVEAVPQMPVFGNGDIRSPADAKRMIDVTGCAGVMIGRFAMADNWIFRDTHALLTTGIVPEPPTRRERVDRMLLHFHTIREHLGDRHAVIQFRKYFAWYAKKVGPCPELRRTLPMVKTVDEWLSSVHAFREELDEQDRGDPTTASAHGEFSSPTQHEVNV